MDSASSPSPSVSTRMSSEDMLARSSKWTLGCDNALLNRIKDFSESLVSQAQGISNDCDSLGTDVSLLHSQVHNVTNQFLMLSNTQFVENRVEEFEETMSADSTSRDIPIKTKAEKEAELISKMKEAIQIGVAAKSAQQNTGGDSGLAGMKLNLPFIIGSSKFFSSRSCGLVEEGNPFMQKNETTINSVDESHSHSHESRSTDSSSLTNNYKPEEQVVNIPGTQPHPPSFIRELYRPPSLNNSLDHEGSVSSDDLFSSSNNRPPVSNASSNSNLAQGHADNQGKSSHSTAVPPVAVNLPKPKGIVDVDELNATIRARAPPPPVDSDESDYDFQPPQSGQGFSRRVFADVDDDEDEDDLFGSSSIFASRANQKADNDDSFFDKPPPTKPSSLFSSHNPQPQPPPPIVYQTTPPPPSTSKRNISNPTPTPDKVTRTLFPDSPSTDDEEDIFVPPSKSHQPVLVAGKEESSKQIPALTRLPSNNGDVDDISPEFSAVSHPDSHQKPKLPYGAVSMFGDMPPPIIPIVKDAPKAEVTSNNQSISTTPAVPVVPLKIEKSGSTFKDNVEQDASVPSFSKPVPPSVQNENRRAVKPKSIFDDDSDDDLFSAIKNVSSKRENQTVAKVEVGVSLFDEASDSFTKSNHVSNLLDNPPDSNHDVPKEPEPELKPKLRYGAVSMFGNLPPPVIPVRKEVSPVSQANNTPVLEKQAPIESSGSSTEVPSVSSLSGDVAAGIDTRNPGPFLTSVASPVTTSMNNTLPETTSVPQVPPATTNILPNVPLSVSKNVPDVGVGATAPMSAVPQTAPAPSPAQEDKSKNVAARQTQKQFNHGIEPPPLRSSSSSESVESRNSRFSKSRSIFDDDSDDDDLFSTKKSSTSRKSVLPVKKSLFDDLSPPASKSDLFLTPDFLSNKYSETPPRADSTHPHPVVEEKPTQEKSKPKLPYGAVSMFGGMPPPVIPSRKSVSEDSEVQQTNTAHQATIAAPVSKNPVPIEQPGSGRSTEKEIFPERLEQNSIRVEIGNPKITKPPVEVEPVNIKKIVKKSSIFDEDSSDEDLFATKNRTTSNKPVPKPVTSFADVTRAEVSKSNGRPPDVRVGPASHEPNPSSTPSILSSVSKTAATVKAATKQQKSIFDESDSDGDIFTSTSGSIQQQRKKTKAVGNKIFQSKNKAISKGPSIFGDDSDDDIFTVSKSKPKQNQNVYTTSADNIVEKSKTLPETRIENVPNSSFHRTSTVVAVKDDEVGDIIVVSKNSQAEADNCVEPGDATNLDNIESDGTIVDHFVDLCTDPPNLLPSIVKNRPKIGTSRRRPTRKPKPTEAVSNNNLESLLASTETAKEGDDDINPDHLPFEPPSADADTSMH